MTIKRQSVLWTAEDQAIMCPQLAGDKPQHLFEMLAGDTRDFHKEVSYQRDRALARYWEANG